MGRTVGQQSPAEGAREPAAFGPELRRRREAAGFSLSGLARKISYSRSYLSKIETGAKPAGPELAKRCDTVLGAHGELAALATPAERTRRSPAAEVPLTRTEVPRQLPSAVRYFIGRDRELGALTRRIDADGARVIALDGSPGVGKTTLALRWARTTADRFPDGHLYLNLRGFEASGRPMDTAEAVRGFLDGLGVRAEAVPADTEAALALYRSRTDGKRMLIVLDNAADTAQVRPLLPGSSGAVVLITSRKRLTGLIASDHVESLTVDRLSVDEAAELFTGLIGARRCVDGELVDELVRRCARLPLALSILGARLASDSYLELGTLARELDAEQSLAALSTGDGADTDIRAVFSWSYRAVSAPAARLFQLLGAHPGPHIGRAAITSLAGADTQHIDALLDELARAHLIERIAPGRYWFHDLLRAYAAELGAQQDSTGERADTTARVLDHYLHTGHAAARLLSHARDPLHLDTPQPGTVPEPLADFAAALRWFDAEYTVLLSVIASAQATGHDGHIDKLAWTLEAFIPRHGRWHDHLITQRLALAAATRAENVSAQARAHRGLGRAYCWLGKDTESQQHYQQALRHYRELDDAVGGGHTCLGIVWALERNGNYARALGYARESLACYRTAKQVHWEARGLNAVAWCEARCGHHAQALRLCAQALPLHRRLRDGHSEAATLGIMGYASQHLGEHRTAVSYYHCALHLVRGLRDPYSEALVLHHLGEAYLSIGDPAAARQAWTSAADTLEGLNNPEARTIRGKLRILPG